MSMHAGITLRLMYSGGMKGGLQRWKRGASGHGVKYAVAHALGGECDATTSPTGAVKATGYAEIASEATRVHRFVL